MSRTAKDGFLPTVKGAGWEELPNAQSFFLIQSFSSFSMREAERCLLGVQELPETPIWTQLQGAGLAGWEQGALQQKQRGCPSCTTFHSFSECCCILFLIFRMIRLTARESRRGCTGEGEIAEVPSWEAETRQDLVRDA